MNEAALFAAVLAMIACIPTLAYRTLAEAIGCGLVAAAAMSGAAILIPFAAGWWITVCVGRVTAGALAER